VQDPRPAANRRARACLADASFTLHYAIRKASAWGDVIGGSLSASHRRSDSVAFREFSSSDV
jgi:hypothetical protein